MFSSIKLNHSSLQDIFTQYQHLHIITKFKFTSVQSLTDRGLRTVVFSTGNFVTSHCVRRLGTLCTQRKGVLTGSPLQIVLSYHQVLTHLWIQTIPLFGHYQTINVKHPLARY